MKVGKEEGERERNKERKEKQWVSISMNIGIKNPMSYF